MARHGHRRAARARSESCRSAVRLSFFVCECVRARRERRRNTQRSFSAWFPTSDILAYAIPGHTRATTLSLTFPSSSRSHVPVSIHSLSVPVTEKHTTAHTSRPPTLALRASYCISSAHGMAHEHTPCAHHRRQCRHIRPAGRAAGAFTMAARRVPAWRVASRS